MNHFEYTLWGFGGDANDGARIRSQVPLERIVLEDGTEYRTVGRLDESYRRYEMERWPAMRSAKALLTQEQST